MAQLRQDYEQFAAQETEVVVVGPENSESFSQYWLENDLPFTGLPDPDHEVLKRYGQEVKLFKFGRMPAMALIDKSGTVRFVHYGKSMADIPPNEELLDTLQEMNRSARIHWELIDERTKLGEVRAAN